MHIITDLIRRKRLNKVRNQNKPIFPWTSKLMVCYKKENAWQFNVVKAYIRNNLTELKLTRKLGRNYHILTTLEKLY